GEYPKVTEKTEMKVDFPPELQNQIPDEIAQIVTSNHKRQIYDFIDSDDNWKITLTNNFLALTSNKYKCWEEFREHLLKPLDAITSIYSPPYFSRIGLRYKDLIKRSNLGLIGTPWCKLLSPYISGILSSTELCDFVENSASKIEIRLKDGTSLVRISHGIVIDTSDGESCYLIDSDFFNTEKTANEKVIEKLNYYNQMGTRLIQWCITDKLKGAMGQ
ncbi:MAG: TIGR04255 family protein, partial [Chloroflexota bacterium]|nr:TIGR04255 family protein [Chloroflexota bacterium]